MLIDEQELSLFKGLMFYTIHVDKVDSDFGESWAYCADTKTGQTFYFIAHYFSINVNRIYKVIDEPVRLIELLRGLTKNEKKIIDEFAKNNDDNNRMANLKRAEIETPANIERVSYFNDRVKVIDVSEKGIIVSDGGKIVWLSSDLFVQKLKKEHHYYINITESEIEGEKVQRGWAVEIS